MEDVFSTRISIIVICSIGIFLLTLSFVHFLLYLFYRKAKENLFYSLFAFGYALLFFIGTKSSDISAKPSVQLFADMALEILVPLLLLSLLLFIHRVYESHFPKWLWWLVIAAGLIPIFDSFTDWINSTVAFGSIMWLCISSVITMMMGTYKAIRKKIPGAKILGTGIGLFALFLFFMISVVFYSGSFYVHNLWIALGIIIVLLSIPISMSIYLAYNFSYTNRSLQNKLIEVEELSAKTISQEKEKQEILSRQKEVLEIQVAERTKEITEQKKVIENKNKDITDSINYAKRIQDAILPSEKEIKKLFPESFVFFKPKDIVSGDFYFYSPLERGKGCVIAAVDCTGHGVPGAFMSMMGHDLLQNIINEKKITDTSKILDDLHKQVLFALNRDIIHRDSRDGMDVALVCLPPLLPSLIGEGTGVRLQFSGAVRPLYYFDSNGFHEVKGDRWSIGGVKEIDGQPFSSVVIPLQHPTTFYIFSDGFADQFGGKEEKKFMTKRLRELLASIQDKNMDEQKIFLEAHFEEWKAGREQTDDVMMIGVRI